MNILSKLHKFTKFVPKKLAVLLLTLAAVLVPAAIYAWGPSRTTFTMDKPASYVTFNSITNNPQEGDERNFVRAKDATNTNANGFYDIVPVQDNGTYLVRMYVHNNAASNLNLVAQNVTATTGLQSGYSTKVCLTGYIDSTNANPTEVYDDVCFTNTQNFKINYVGGSAKYYNNAGTFSIGNELFSTGAKLGYSSMNGNIPGCLQYSGVLTFEVKAHLEVAPKPSYDVSKTVDKTSAKPGDTINYTITAKNTGNVDLTNVKINDTLPAYYSEASETVNAPSAISGSIVKNGSITISKLPVGGTATVKISYKIKGESAFDCGKTTTITNKVTSSTDQDKTEDMTDNNQVSTDVTYTCKPAEKHPSYDLVKTVSPTGTVKLGDTLTYTLKFTNTGDEDLTNVVIKDNLPAEVEWTSVKIAGTNASGLPTGDGWGTNLLANGITISKVSVGGNVVVTITTKVKSDAVTATKCGTNSKTFTNSATSKTDQKTDQANNADEDNANNNSVSNQVTVDKTCKSSYDVIKSVDKDAAKPGDTLTYTLLVKNTGETDLTNVKVVDKLPANVTYVNDSTTVNGTKVADGVIEDGLTIKTLQQGATATVKFQVKIAVANANNFKCNTTTNLTNTVTSSTDQDKTEDRTDNNSATTKVIVKCAPKPCDTKPSIDENDKNCRPCPYNPNMNWDDKDCYKPCKYNPNIPADDKNCRPKDCSNGQNTNCNHNDNNNTNVNNNNNSSNSSSSSNSSVVVNFVGSNGAVQYTPASYTPGEIVATGPTETLAALLGAGLLTFAGVAYVKSRQVAKANR